MREIMLCSIEKRFANFERSKPAAVVCLLDPRYKDRPFSDLC